MPHEVHGDANKAVEVKEVEEKEEDEIKDKSKEIKPEQETTDEEE